MEKRTSVENALQLLKLFSMDEPELSVTAVAQKLNVAKSTAYRLLSSLAQEGFVYKDIPSNRYSIGASVLPMMDVVQSQIPITNEARPILTNLANQTNENAHLGILEGFHLVYLETVEGLYHSEDYIHIGKRKPAHCTSGGKAILAFNQEMANLVRNHLNPYTPYTVTDSTKFIEQLQTIKNNGYVISKQEYQPHIIGLAVPVYNDKNKVIASISMTIDTSRYMRNLENKFISALKKSANELTKMIILRRRSDLYV